MQVAGAIQGREVRKMPTAYWCGPGGAYETSNKTVPRDGIPSSQVDDSASTVQHITGCKEAPRLPCTVHIFWQKLLETLGSRFVCLAQRFQREVMSVNSHWLTYLERSWRSERYERSCLLAKQSQDES